MGEEIEKEIGSGLRVRINLKECNATVIESPKATGTVVIPRYVVHKKQKYKIISINERAFNNKNHIEFLTFPEDSEIETFKKDCFNLTFIKKLRIPPNLKNLEDNWCDGIYNLTEIEISPKNEYFIYFNEEFLLGKSRTDIDKFDVLHFARFDIENAEIPPQVRIIKSFSFVNHNKLKTVTFSEGSELKEIEDNAFQSSTIERLFLPSSVDKIGDFCFFCVKNLKSIELSPRNSTFSIYEHKYLLKKSQRGSKNFDFLVFSNRDIEIANIPSQIKIIGYNAFQFCNRLKTITFESNSSLEIIGDNAFSNIFGPEKIILPSSVREINGSFNWIFNTRIIEFLCKTLNINGSYCFSKSKNLTLISFPNAEQITFGDSSMSNLPKETKILVRRDTKLTGKGLKECESQIIYIDDDETKISSTSEVKNDAELNSKDKKEKKDKKSKTEKAEKQTNKSKESYDKRIEKLEEENSTLKNYVSYLSYHLNKYEEPISLEDFKENMNKYMNEIKESYDKEESKYKKESLEMIDSKEECERYRMISKIGEGSTSEVFKVFDEQLGYEVCKKVIKECQEETTMKTFRNALKEIDFLNRVKHPCICESFCFNLQEKLQPTKNDEEYETEYDEDGKLDEEEKTTISLFIEYLPYSINDIREKGILNNTLKVLISIEVAFGMSHIHSEGMIHRDLKIEHVMLNNVFNAKIIDFGLVHMKESEQSMNTLSRGIGTLGYMSPEMLSEEEYDNKTDVYSYGIFLYVLFIGRLPKQSIRARLDKVPIDFPKKTKNLSDYCINLIKRCTSFESTKRPTFDEIIEDIASHSFSLAPGIDKNIILSRYRFLNCIRSQQNQQKQQKQQNKSD